MNTAFVVSRRLALAVVFGLVAFGAVQAHAAVIDFENVTQTPDSTTTFTDNKSNTRTQNFYSSLEVDGLVFTNVSLEDFGGNTVLSRVSSISAADTAVGFTLASIGLMADPENLFSATDVVTINATIFDIDGNSYFSTVVAQVGGSLTADGTPATFLPQDMFPLVDLSTLRIATFEISGPALIIDDIVLADDNTVPEPGTLLLLGPAMLGLYMARRRREVV